MTPVVLENDNEDPEVHVSAMVAEVGAESVATVQAPTLRTRGQLRAARNARWNASGKQRNSPLLQQLSGASDDGSDYVFASDSDGAPVGAPTRAHRLNNRSAPAFDMNALARSVIALHLLGKAPTPKGALLPQRIVSYKYLSVQLHS